MTARSEVVAIVGAGASGTLTALHLLRSAREPLTVALIERDRTFGAGAAFAATQNFHLLNVPAGRMSAFADQPDDFVRWLAGRADAADFVPRRLYREYLAACLARSERDAAPGVRLRRVRGEVVSIVPDAGGLGAQVTLRDRTAIDAARVVLALGNQPPSCIPTMRPFRGYVPDPWRPGALGAIPDDGPVILVGTGLTMVDSVLSLSHAGHPGPFIALSRRGRIPEAHVAPPPPPERLSWCGALPLRALVRIVRDAASRASDWRSVVDGLRPEAQALWRQLSEGDKRRFLRHVRPYWDSARHRLAPEVARTIDALRASGRLVVRAGRLLAIDERDGLFRATWRARGANSNEVMSVSGLVNCTGPAENGVASDPVVATMIVDGHATTGAGGIGLATDEHGALVGGSGCSSQVLFTLGPPRKGDLWESTAIPEIRDQARSLAQSLLARTEMGTLPFFMEPPASL